MTVIWSGVTEEGAIVPVQVDNTGRVIAFAKSEGLDYWEKEGGLLKPSGGESVSVEGTVSSSVGFAGPTAGFSEDININGLNLGRGGSDIENNTAVGRGALLNNTTGNNNTAIGLNALYKNTEGEYNTAIGISALLNNTTGTNNTALGYRALYNNTEGTDNTAIGQNALINNTQGNNNTFIGRNPGLEGLNDTVCISAGEKERLWIDSDGQAGIGTNNPQATLDVAGPALFANGLCGFLSTGEVFFQSRNKTYKLFVSQGGMVSAEEIPTALLGLDDREQLVFPSVIETNDEELLPGMDMDNDNA